MPAWAEIGDFASNFAWGYRQLVHFPEVRLAVSGCAGSGASRGEIPVPLLTVLETQS